MMRIIYDYNKKLAIDVDVDVDVNDNRNMMNVEREVKNVKI